MCQVPETQREEARNCHPWSREPEPDGGGEGDEQGPTVVARGARDKASVWFTGKGVLGVGSRQVHWDIVEWSEDWLWGQTVIGLLLRKLCAPSLFIGSWG